MQKTFHFAVQLRKEKLTKTVNTTATTITDIPK